MAVQIETQGQLAEFLEILSRRRWQMLLPALLILTLGSALAVLIPKKFLVRSEVEVRPVSVSVSGKEAENAPNQLRSYERIRKVLQERRNQKFLALSGQAQVDFITDVRGDVRVKLERPTGGTSTFVGIEYTHGDPKWAEEFLRALRDDWKQDVLERDKNKVNDEAEKLRAEVTSLEKQVKEEEEQLTGIYKRYSISATQPIPGGSDPRGEDPEYARLQKTKSDHAQAVLDLAKAEQKVANLEERLRNAPEKLSEQQLVEGVSNSDELLALDAQILEQQTELARYRPIHHKYPLIQKKIDELTEKREQLKKLATRNELTSIAKANPLRLELQRLLDDARLEVALLTTTRDTLAQTIARDARGVDDLYPVYREIRLRSQKAGRLAAQLEAASLRYRDKLSQAKQLASPLADPFTITQEVRAPTKPTEPNPWLIVAFALVAGLALGLAIALTAEYSRNCFRNAHDIARVMVAPVLGGVNRIVTRRQRRLAGVRRALVATASATLVAAVAWVTWAWARDPELLSPGLRARIETLRDLLR